MSDMPPVVYAVARGWDGWRVFLQDADAMVYPYPRIVEVLTHLREKLPEVERVGAYATPRDLLRRSVGELKTLRDQGLGIIYLGVETGDPGLLERIGKRVNYDQMAEAGRRAEEAGITLSVTVILGLGGAEGSERHARETARLLSDIDPEYAGALTLTLVPGTPLYEEAENGAFHPISPFQSLLELKVLVEQASFTNCFFSSMHASNYYSVRGTLPWDRDKMLAELEQVLARRDPAMLRPEHLRGL
ncbi:MAG: radical SAM protein [Clostridia bacterium]|nr:MAG: radical SAM protein [Clostridia bacterium]